MISNQMVLLGSILAGVIGLMAASSLLFASSMKHRILGAWALSAVLAFAGGYSLSLIGWPVIVKVVCMVLYALIAFSVIKGAELKWLDD